MYLKRLEIKGFKSFADKTVIKFEDGITGVVGPNGSGKSNISDAIRWVLGEQSVKSLRGSKMEDVIFSGASGRTSLGFAEVTMVFDNSTNIFPIEYQELAVTRRMFRSGESEYYINKNSCRLKDIKEVFMDTGVGKDGYSIIGQGRIDDILSSKSEDRRKIFEEAAGIVKYKSRKEESEKKLQKTKDNLIRIDDIVMELEKQIEPLREQSLKAKRYLEVSEAHKSLDLELFRLEFDRLKSEADNHGEEISRLNRALEESNSKRNAIKEESLEEEQISLELEEEIKEKSDSRYRMLSDRDKCEGDIKLLEEKIRGQLKETERIFLEKEEISRELELYRADMDKKEKFKSEYMENLELKNGLIAEREENLNSLSSEMSLAEEEVEKKKEDALGHLNTISEYKLKLNTLESHRENLTLRFEQIGREIEKNEDKKDEISSLNRGRAERLELLEQELKTFESNIEDKKFLRESKLKEKKGLQMELESLKSRIQDMESNLRFLKEMKEEYEGYYKGVKNFFLQSKNIESLNKGIDGLVAELLTVQKAHEKAIEVSLGGSLQNIVVESQNHGKRCIEFLKQRRLGRITFLPRDSIKGKSLNSKEQSILSEDGVIGLASDIVEFDSKYEAIFRNLLGRTIVIDSMDTMIRISQKYGNFLKLVTLEGDVLNPGGSMTGGSFKGNSLSLLGRERQINELEDSLRSDKIRQTGKAEKYKSLESDLGHIEKSIVDIEKEDRELRFEKNSIESQYSHTVEQERELASGGESFKKELVQIDLELGKIDSQGAKINLSIEEYKSKVESIQSEVESQNKALESGKGDIEKKSSELVELKIERASLEETFRNMESDAERVKGEIEKSSAKLERLDAMSESIKKERVNIEKQVKSYSQKAESLGAEIGKAKSEIEGIQSAKGRVIDKLKTVESRLKSIDAEIENSEKEMLKLELKREKAELKLDSLRERIWEEYELSYSMILDRSTSGKEIGEIESELGKTRQELKKIGNVNLEAIEEYEKVSERYEFLDKQRDDLVEAEKSLKHVIKEMNHQMREQFKHRFEEIRIQFEDIFIKLFGGGKADIKLDTPEDVLASGIEIIAQPPGKKLQSLSLLSGGERALTAIAILFAILRTRPTPFCVLDEIEAALDESNVYRYAEYLESFAKDTQFIVITHRKGTMESADSLYGVTMEQDGISKILSVKLTDKLIAESSRG